MSTDGPPAKASLRELEPLFAADAAAGRERAPRHSTLRLQPTVLPPPPSDGSALARGASPEDDLDLGLEADEFARRRQLLLAAAGVAVAIAGTVAYLAFGPSGAPRTPVAAPQPQEAPRPAVVAPGPLVPEVPPTVSTPPLVTPPTVAAPPAITPPAITPPAITPPAAQAATDISMGQVSSELVPPSTDGLSPARKVGSIRIIVEGDREIRP